MSDNKIDCRASEVEIADAIMCCLEYPKAQLTIRRLAYERYINIQGDLVLDNIKALLKLQCETTSQPLCRYGWKYCDSCTVYSNVYDCIMFLCNKIAALEARK